MQKAKVELEFSIFVYTVHICAEQIITEQL